MNLRTVLICALSLHLAACGGSKEKENTTPEPTKEYARVKVIDGYIRGASAFVDLNMNGVADSGEPQATSESGGVAKIDITGTGLGSIDYQVTVNIGEGAIDESTISSETPSGVPFTTENAFQMKTLSGSFNATPFTTIGAMNISYNFGIVGSESEISILLDITDEALVSDYIAENNTHLALLATQIVKQKLLPNSLVNTPEEREMVTTLLKMVFIDQSLKYISTSHPEANTAENQDLYTDLVVEFSQLFIDGFDDQNLELISSNYIEIAVATANLVGSRVWGNSLGDDLELSQRLNIIHNVASNFLETLRNSLTEGKSINESLEHAMLMVQLIENNILKPELLKSIDYQNAEIAELISIVLTSVSEELTGYTVADVGTQHEETLITEINFIMLQLSGAVSTGSLIDLDADGVSNLNDSDIDGDGVPNDQDVFIFDKTENKDEDSDRIGDNKDTFVSIGFDLNYSEAVRGSYEQSFVTKSDDKAFTVTNSGIYDLTHATASNQPKIQFGNEFEKKNIEYVTSADSLSSSKIIFTGQTKSIDFEHPSQSYIAVADLEGNEPTLKMNLDLKIENVSEYAQEIKVSSVHVIKDSNYVLAYVETTSDYTKHLISYRVNNDNTLTYVSEIDLSAQLLINENSSIYARNIDINDAKSEIYISFEIYHEDTFKNVLTTFNIDDAGVLTKNSDIAMEFSTPTSIYSWKNNRFLAHSDTLLSVLELDNNSKAFSEVSAIPVEMLSHLALSPETSKIALHGTLYDNNESSSKVTVYDLINIETISELYSVNIPDGVQVAVFSPTSDYLFIPGYSNTPIHKLEVETSYLESLNFGLRSLTAHSSLMAHNEQLFSKFFYQPGHIDRIAIEGEAITTTSLFLPVKLWDLTWNNALFFTDENTVMSHQTGVHFGEMFAPSTYYSEVAIQTWSESSKYTYSKVLLDSKFTNFMVQEMLRLNDQYFVVKGHAVDDTDNYFLKLFKLDSNQNAVEKDSVSVEKNYSSLSIVDELSFKLDLKLFVVEDDKLKQTSIAKFGQVGEYFHNGAVRISNNNGFNVRLISDDFSNVNKIASENTLVQIAKVSDTEFAALSLSEDKLYLYVDHYSIDMLGTLTKINKLKMATRMAESEYELKVKFAVDMDARWLWLVEVKDYNQTKLFRFKFD